MIGKLHLFDILLIVFLSISEYCYKIKNNSDLFGQRQQLLLLPHLSVIIILLLDHDLKITLRLRFMKSLCL